MKGREGERAEGGCVGEVDRWREGVSVGGEKEREIERGKITEEREKESVWEERMELCVEGVCVWVERRREGECVVL